MKSLIPFRNPLKLHQKVYRKNKFGLKQIFRWVLKIAGIFLIFIAILFAWYSKDLPTPGKIKDRYPIESTHIYDRNGKPLYDVFGEVKRTIIPANEIPDLVKYATISAEDKDFYRHFGFSIKGIIRAAINNIMGKTGYVTGGSTITQQYVKNALLSPKKTFTRKIKELILTIEIEVMYSKDEILGMYLNEIPYGSNAYGIQAAAQTYFSKDAKDLDLAQSAALAALPKAPTYYSPYGSHPDKFQERKDYVLDRLAILGYITQKEADETKSQKLTISERRESITAPHFVFFVKEKLIEMYDEKMVEEGGLKVTTTLDLDKQKIAEEAVGWGYERNKRFGSPNAALVSLDPKTGQILAMVGSHDYFDQDRDGQVNVTTSERQPGSSFKPIAYATAMKGKYNPATVLFDVTTDFGNYTPQNYDGTTHGPVTMRQALANSLNIPAVKTLYLAGLDNVLDQAHKMGITTLNQPERYGLALVLGGGEVKPLDLTTAYGVFANQGNLHETTGILKVEDNSGKILYEYKENKNQKEVLDPQVAYQISSILSDNDARNMVFGALQGYLSFPDRPVAVKTGTTSEYRDAWTVGYTPSIVTGVWVGNNDNTAMKNNADGSMAAAPIWHYYMDKILSGTNIEQFSRPSEIQTLTVDKFSNKLPTDQSPETITDIFSTWQVPTEYDDIHLKVKICRLCGDDKLATDLCPNDQIEEKTYTKLHSEVPSNPNWENPVQAWIEGSAMATGDPPNETCELTAERPTISITNPTNSQTVAGNFELATSLQSTHKIVGVEFFIDGVSITTKVEEPYSITYNANNLASSEHTLLVVATDEKGLTARDSITFSVSKDLVAPGNVTGVTLTPQSQSVAASWINPVDNDLMKIRIYLSTTAGSLGNLLANEVPVTPSSTTSYTIPNLNSGVTYYFTFRPVDGVGNENKTTTQYIATPL